MERGLEERLETSVSKCKQKVDGVRHLNELWLKVTEQFQCSIQLPN